MTLNTVSVNEPYDIIDGVNSSLTNHKTNVSLSKSIMLQCPKCAKLFEPDDDKGFLAHAVNCLE